MREATLCFLIRGDPPYEILLGFKKVGFGANKYNGIGGKVEAGEAIVVAAARELEEETGVVVSEADLRRVGHLTFIFPAKPAWDQVVHVFLARRWQGEATESREMVPTWFGVDDIPFERMWADDLHWLRRVLEGERIRGRFMFKADNESIEELEVESWDGHTSTGIDT
jgi:8-oxo-dGTP pyrophosphatase MutT (NUDIX family)